MRLIYTGCEIKNDDYFVRKNRGFFVVYKKEESKKVCAFTKWFCEEWELRESVIDNEWDDSHNYISVLGVQTKNLFDSCIKKYFKENYKEMDKFGIIY